MCSSEIGMTKPASPRAFNSRRRASRRASWVFISMVAVLRSAPYLRGMNDTTSARPPVAAKKPHSVTHHGIEVSDDYAWLRDPGYPEVTDKQVLAHLEAENAWFEARMAPHKPLVETLFQEMRGRIKEADKSVPQKDGDYLYWIEFEEGAEYKKWWR